MKHAVRIIAAVIALIVVAELVMLGVGTVLVVEWALTGAKP